MATKFANSSWAFEMPKNKTTTSPTTATVGRTSPSGITSNTLLETVTNNKPSAVLDTAATAAAQKKQDVTAAAVAEPVYSTTTTGVSTSSTDEYTKRLNEALAKQKAAVNAAYNQSKTNLDAAKEAAKRNNYVSYMQGIKNAPQTYAVVGNGGQAESLATKQRLNYENNQNAIDQQYLADLLQIETNRDNDIISADQDYLTQLMSLYKPATTKSGGTKQTELTGYKVNGKTMSKDEYLAHLASLGMSAEEAYNFMKNNNILY